MIDNPDTAIAPGLDVIAEVEFFTTEEKEYSDQLVVYTEVCPALACRSLCPVNDDRRPDSSAKKS